MKSLLFITGIFNFLSFSTVSKFNYLFFPGYADTSHIIHVLDGSTAEWPDTIFQTDKETSIRYAVDNDAQHLFLALRIADFRTQMKLMRQGMNLFIDVKGKRKENRDIEFPMKQEEGFSGGGSNTSQGNQPNQERNEQRGNIDKKMFRESMALHLLAMKVVGFTDTESSPQGLQMDGSVNINFTWDSADVMHIEYFIPFNMFGDGVALNKKTISVGWKINGTGSPGNTVAFTTTSVQGRPAGNGDGTRNNGRNGGGNNTFSQADMEKMTQEQSFWTKYIISF